MKRWFALALVGVLALFSGCAMVGAQEASGKIQVVGTIFPPCDFARQVAGERAEVKMLLKPGTESHSFDPSPADILAIENCDVFLYIGGENERWVEDILSAVDLTNKRVVRLIGSVSALTEEFAPGMQGEDEGGDELDEHIWTSPLNAARMVGAIADALCAAQPASEDFFRENERQYRQSLDDLDASLRDLVNRAARKELVFGDRFPFRYLADEYGLTYYAAFPGCAHEAEPSAQTIAGIIDEIRQKDIPVVFHIEQGNERVTDIIAEETGAKSMLLHSCHNLTKDEAQRGETYLSLMRNNFLALEAALT